MYETLLRPHHVDAAPALTPIGAVGARLKQSEARREEKRLRQIANARAGAERRAAKRKAEDDEDDEYESGSDVGHPETIGPRTSGIRGEVAGKDAERESDLPPVDEEDEEDEFPIPLRTRKGKEPVGVVGLKRKR